MGRYVKVTIAVSDGPYGPDQVVSTIGADVDADTFELGVINSETLTLLEGAVRIGQRIIPIKPETADAPAI